MQVTLNQKKKRKRERDGSDVWMTWRKLVSLKLEVEEAGLCVANYVNIGDSGIVGRRWCAYFVRIIFNGSR